MKKSAMIWMISAIVYVGIVIAAYSVYASINPKQENHTNQINMEQEGESMNDQHSHHQHPAASTGSDITPKLSYDNGELTIELKDSNHQAPELEVSHEQYMHLIVVSSDLQEYHHVHPVQVGEGVYQQNIDLTNNSYKVIVDIAPKGLQYSVEPIALLVGESQHEHGGHQLVVDTDFTKTINGQSVELTTQSFEANKEVMLNFEVKGVQPDPYLGALGHVVIIDEAGENYIHVHPVADDKTVFEAHFDKPGIYKLWAEFKFGEQVNAYPFVIEVK